MSSSIFGNSGGGSSIFGNNGGGGSSIFNNNSGQSQGIFGQTTTSSAGVNSGSIFGSGGGSIFGGGNAGSGGSIFGSGTTTFSPSTTGAGVYNTNPGGFGMNQGNVFGVNSGMGSGIFGGGMNNMGGMNGMYGNQNGMIGMGMMNNMNQMGGMYGQQPMGFGGSGMFGNQTGMFGQNQGMLGQNQGMFGQQYSMDPNQMAMMGQYGFGPGGLGTAFPQMNPFGLPMNNQYGLGTMGSGLVGAQMNPLGSPLGGPLTNPLGSPLSPLGGPLTFAGQMAQMGMGGLPYNNPEYMNQLNAILGGSQFGQANALGFGGSSLFASNPQNSLFASALGFDNALGANLSRREALAQLLTAQQQNPTQFGSILLQTTLAANEITEREIQEIGAHHRRIGRLEDIVDALALETAQLGMRQELRIQRIEKYIHDQILGKAVGIENDGPDFNRNSNDSPEDPTNLKSLKALGERYNTTPERVVATVVPVTGGTGTA